MIMKKVIDAIYKYLYGVDDPDECKKKLDNVLEFVVRLHHSFVDNDKPKSANDINMDILRVAEQNGLRVCFVDLNEKK